MSSWPNTILRGMHKKTQLVKMSSTGRVWFHIDVNSATYGMLLRKQGSRHAMILARHKVELGKRKLDREFKKTDKYRMSRHQLGAIFEILLKKAGRKEENRIGMAKQ